METIQEDSGVGWYTLFFYIFSRRITDGNRVTQHKETETPELNNLFCSTLRTQGVPTLK